MPNNLYPLTFKPVYQDYIWGGSRIPQTFNRPVPEGIYAESWEISDREDGMSIISNGIHAGKSLADLLNECGADILGTNVKGNKLPLLFKLIDSKQQLSVQVHPNDATAAEFGGEAKTEMWYMLGDNETQVFCGLKEGVTKESFLQAVEDGTSGDTLNAVPVVKGDAIFVPGGRVHAIDTGCLILEIQQNSNTTYRLYDWDRVDANGVGRPLHIEQATDVITWDDNADPLVAPVVVVDEENLKLSEVLSCPYFSLDKIEYSVPVPVELTGTSFHALFVAEGEAQIEWEGGVETAPAGTSILIPAALPGYTLNGKATIIRTIIPG